MIECEADVTPDQSWSENGTANVVLKPSCGRTGTYNLPLKHFPPGDITIRKEEHPQGLVVIPMGTIPTSETVSLPCKISSSDPIILHRQDWPEGVVGIFIEE